MKSYRNILVAIDCSPVDETVINHAASLAFQLGATLHLLHVVHSHTLDQERALRQESIATLERHRLNLQSEGIEARVIIRSGEPEREILNELENNGYDLLAMATHGHHLAGRILFGSVSRTLMEKITIPLLMIRPER